MVPSVDNENEAGRTGDSAPYFVNEMVTYACNTGYTPSTSSIVASCTTGIPPTWTAPANADTVCRPGKTLYYFDYCITFVQSEHKTIMKAAPISEGFN